jgi:hypothetical protein
MHDLDVPSWLQACGMGRYQEAFNEHDIRGDILQDLTEMSLQSIGVSSTGDRLRILRDIRALNSQATQQPPTKQKKKGSGPVKVLIGYKVESVGEVNCLHSIFFVHFKLFAKWTDPMLAGVSAEKAEELRVTAHHADTLREATEGSFAKCPGLFDPDLAVLNVHQLTATYFECKITDRVAGCVKWSKYYSGWCEHDIERQLANFPFDFQDLRICIRSHKTDSTKCELELWPGVHTIESQLEQNEWQVMGTRADHLETDGASSSTGKVYSEFHICIMVARFPNWYLENGECACSVH